MFDFRIVVTADGVEVADRTLQTPYSSLSAVQMVKYTEWDKNLVYMDRLARQKRKQQEKQERQARNPFRKIVAACGLI